MHRLQYLVFLDLAQLTDLFSDLLTCIGTYIDEPSKPLVSSITVSINMFVDLLYQFYLE